MRFHTTSVDFHEGTIENARMELQGAIEETQTALEANGDWEVVNVQALPIATRNDIGEAREHYVTERGFLLLFKMKEKT